MPQALGDEVSQASHSGNGRAQQLCVYGFPKWKRRYVRQCLPGAALLFVSRRGTLPSQGDLVLWGMEPVPGAWAADAGVVRIEDGFLRSVGLGADIVSPLSWVVDHLGMHYDSTRASDLERMLATSRLAPPQLERACGLRGRIVKEGLTKYNVGSKDWRRPARKARVVLVVGQVESDSSLRWAAPSGASNIELLRSVRTQRKDSYLLYKPHPDVLASMRLPGVDEARAAEWCDEVIGDVSMSALLPQVDEVHVWTSLAGFEALLHGKQVHCHGHPFYAGWGLTIDTKPHPRRTRRLSLDELVHAALIEYPVYLSPDGNGLITPEQAVGVLIDWRERAPARVTWRTHVWRFFVRRVAGVR